ncbi:zinc ribbon domain-containing protein, partial [Bacillus sp. D-CC]
ALVSNIDSASPLQEAKESKKTQAVLLALELTPQAWSMAHFSPLEVSSPALDHELKKFTKKASDNKLAFSFVSGISVNGIGMKDVIVAQGGYPEDLAEVEEVNGAFHYGLLLLIIPIPFTEIPDTNENA